MNDSIKTQVADDAVSHLSVEYVCAASSVSEGLNKSEWTRGRGD